MQRNLLVFVVLASLIMAGWFWMTTGMNKTKTKDADPKKLVQGDKDKTVKDKTEPDAKDKDIKDKDTKDKDKNAKEKEGKEKDKDAKEKDKKDEKKEDKKERKQEPPTTETLGGDGFHMTVDTTNRGGAVRRVTLNHFKQADWRGRPVAGDSPLEIIQDDEFAPSFRMYHYLQPKDENPVFGLGEKPWTLEGKKAVVKDKDGNVLHEELRYSTTVPDLDHVKIVKTYRLGPKDYHVTLLLEMHDTRDPKITDVQPTPFRYQLTGAQGLPVEGEWYTSIFRNAFIGLVDLRGSLWRKLEESTRISPRRGGDRFPEGPRGDNRMQYAGVANQYFAVMIVVDNIQLKKADGGVDNEKILAWARPTLESREIRGILGTKSKDDDTILFTDFTDAKRASLRYTLLPRTKKHLEDLGLHEGDKAVLSFYETPEGQRIASWVRLGETLKPQFDDITVRVNSEVIELSPGDQRKHQFMLYHGPIKAALLAQFTGEKEVPEELVTRYTHTLHLRTLTDYPNDNFFGKISSWIMLTDLIILFTRLMHWLLNLLHYVFGYGLGIVVLTVIVRGVMFPISRRQALFSIKMQELAPELKKIQDKYPDDPQARLQAQQEFYRKHGINPLGSCWPVFLQMPIFLGLYFALQESIHFRLAGFLWIQNLAAPDMLLYWSESIPMISSPDHASGFLSALYLGPYLNILPMIAVVFMMVQQMQTMPPPTDDQQAMQQKMLKYMTIFFGIMFYKVAAGLCIYFISSSLWGMAERKLLPKKKPIPTEPTSTSSSTAIVAKPQPNSKGKGRPGKNKDKDKEKDEPVTTFDKIKALWREILKQAEKK